MADLYTIVIPTPAGVPDTVELHVMASRRDGKPLTREELEAVSALYPPPTAEGCRMLARAIEAAPSAVEATPARRTSSGTKARKPTAKRAAAKRPASR